jgi:hypothetical protein
MEKMVNNISNANNPIFFKKESYIFSVETEKERKIISENGAGGEVSVGVEQKVNRNDVKVVDVLKWERTVEVEREISRNGIKVGGIAPGELSTVLEGKVDSNGVGVASGIKKEVSIGVIKKEVSIGVKGKIESGNDTGIEGEAGVYIEPAIWSKSHISLGKAQRVKENENEYIICKEGFLVNVGYGVNVGVGGSVTVYNGQDSITGIIDLSGGEVFSVGVEAQRGASWNTSNWVLDFGGSIFLDIGSLLGNSIPAIKLFLEGKLQLQEAASESKNEIKEEADKVLQNQLSQGLNKVKHQTVNELRGSRNTNKDQIQSKIQEKNQQIERKRNEFYKKSLFKAWNLKKHQIKQRLYNEAKRRINSIIPKFSEGVINKSFSVLPLPYYIKQTIRLRDGAVTHVFNSILLSAFSSPIEKIINEVNVTDFFKDIK